MADEYSNPWWMTYSLPEPTGPGSRLYYEGVAAGTIKPEKFEDLFSGNDHALSAGEFSAFSPQVQAWARANPQAFVQNLLAHRNSANQDLGSVGAEGGYSDLSKVAVSGDQLNYDDAGYMEIHDGGGFGSILAGLALSAVLGPQMMAWTGNAIAAGAITGGITSAVTGGDPLKGALTGGIGGAVGQFASDLPGGSNYNANQVAAGRPILTDPGIINPSNLTRAAGSGLIAAASGGNPWIAAGGSLVGSVVGEETGSQLAAQAARTGVGLIGSNMTDSDAAATTLPAITTGMEEAPASEPVYFGFGAALPKFIDLRTTRDPNYLSRRTAYLTRG